MSCCGNASLFRTLARKDPSLTGRFVKQYEAYLLKLIKVTIKEVIAEMRKQTASNAIKPATRSLAEAEIDMKTYKDAIGKVITVRFREPASNETSKVMEEQMKRGVMRADQLLVKLPGFDALIGGMEIDKNVFTAIQERGLAEIMGISDAMEKKIIEEVSAGILAGEGARDIAERLEDVGDYSQSQALRVARTETMTAFNSAAKDRYDRYGIEQVSWLTGGSNICNEVKGFDGVFYAGGCQGLNKQKFDIGSAPPVPLHPNCKCILQPVIEEV